MQRSTAYPLERPRGELSSLPPGEAGTRATLHKMRKLVRRWKTDPLIRRTAVELVGGRDPLRQKDYAGQVRRLHAFVRDSIRYVGDVTGVETLHSPLRILEQRAGDCDDKALLLATLLESIGHQTRFAALSMRPGVFSHVLVETRVGAGWLPLETTEPVPAGWYPTRVLRRLVVHNSDAPSVHGLGGLGQQPLRGREEMGPPLPPGFVPPAERINVPLVLTGVGLVVVALWWFDRSGRRAGRSLYRRR